MLRNTPSRARETQHESRGSLRGEHAASDSRRRAAGSAGGRGTGQIINVSSAVGLVPIPFGGFYSASKFALEAYTEVLRHEVKSLGVRVSLVEPGFIKTRLGENTQEPAGRITAYDPWRKRAFEARRRYAGAAPEPTVVAECILRIVESPRPRLRYPIGKEATRGARLRRVLPEALFERGMRRYFRL
ncbi:MAG TPA: SDR family NAD(P)-dependent oxidoreductase, partial [bacterium]|nr:SDR family NAD(P)-dependent oxidoreductase [bacterium]